MRLAETIWTGLDCCGERQLRITIVTILGLEQETGFSFYIIIISIAATHVIDPFVGFQLAGPGQCLVLYPCHRSRQLAIMKIFCEGNQPVNDDGGFAVPTWYRIRRSRAANRGLCRCTFVPWTVLAELCSPSSSYTSLFHAVLARKVVYCSLCLCEDEE